MPDALTENVCVQFCVQSRQGEFGHVQIPVAMNEKQVYFSNQRQIVSILWIFSFYSFALSEFSLNLFGVDTFFGRRKNAQLSNLNHRRNAIKDKIRSEHRLLVSPFWRFVISKGTYAQRRLQYCRQCIAVSREEKSFQFSSKSKQISSVWNQVLWYSFASCHDGQGITRKNWRRWINADVVSSSINKF